ncbi:hypothetical protein BH10ACI1_BH10ACI1_07670 [soil metagenome]
MKDENKPIKDRESEKGAALITVLMISMLLLVASTGLILEVSMNTANVSDATSEQQAYTAAESGIQSAINVLRGNVVLTDANRIDTTKPATDAANRINFRRAVGLSTSNLGNDASGNARLSRWMNYNYLPSGAIVGTRITLGDLTYNPQSGNAFSVSISDPDNTGEIVSFNTQGKFFDPTDNTWKSTIRIGTSPNMADIIYTANSANNLNVTSGSANTNFGSFRISPVGGGSFVLGQDIRFQISVNMTAPYTVTKVLRGSIKAGTFTSTSVVRFDFDSQYFDIMGSMISLNSDPMNVTVGSTTVVSGNITSAEPYRVVIRSTGYGPRNSMKILEATIQKNFFNGLPAPATLTLIGGSGPGYVFEPGDSANVTYSGDDVVSNIIIPPVGVINDTNLADVQSKLCPTCKPNTIGSPANVTTEMPDWLQSTQNLDNVIQNLRQVAQASGRYYANGEVPPDLGNNLTANGITFVDGDLEMAGSGGGLLIVTGKVRFNGAFDFNGLIIITGANGLDRRGGGNGLLQGNIVIAPYNPNNINGGFLTPKYDISGGGNSELRYNSSSFANGLTAVSNFVLGVAEK